MWEKAYTDTQTGLAWRYPEFKGFHANTYWATLETRNGGTYAGTVWLRVGAGTANSGGAPPR